LQPGLRHLGARGPRTVPGPNRPRRHTVTPPKPGPSASPICCSWTHLGGLATAPRDRCTVFSTVRTAGGCSTDLGPVHGGPLMRRCSLWRDIITCRAALARTSPSRRLHVLARWRRALSRLIRAEFIRATGHPLPSRSNRFRVRASPESCHWA
jgi:hypothetical protein